MAKTTIPYSYDNVAKTLHWLIAFAIIVMLVLGWTMINVGKDNPYRFDMFQFHKSLGITILALSLIRLAWRLLHKPPPLPAMPAWEKFAAKTTHVLFYVLMIGMPISGWIIVSTSSFKLPTLLFGMIPLPHLPLLPDLENKKDVNMAFSNMHNYAAFLMAALFVLHAAAAHKHHWLDRDDVLVRMAPGPIARLLNRMRGTK